MGGSFGHKLSSEYLPIGKTYLEEPIAFNQIGEVVVLKLAYSNSSLPDGIHSEKKIADRFEALRKYPQREDQLECE